MLEPPVTPIRKANDGLELPATGFGTYKVNGLAGVDAIKSAIHQGYRLIDSAFNYENEGVVGRAIQVPVPLNPAIWYRNTWLSSVMLPWGMTNCASKRNCAIFVL